MIYTDDYHDYAEKYSGRNIIDIGIRDTKDSSEKQGLTAIDVLKKMTKAEE